MKPKRVVVATGTKVAVKEVKRRGEIQGLWKGEAAGFLPELNRSFESEADDVSFVT